MKSRLSLLILLVLGSRSLLAAGDAPVKGAKELFYDCTDGSVVSASQPNTFTTQQTPPPIRPKKSQKKIGVAGSNHRMEGTVVPVVQLDGPRRPLPPRPANSSTLGLSYWIELVDRDGKGQQVTDNRIFRSGERIRLHFLSNADGNVALIQLGSSGTSSVLFPDPVKGLNDNRITAGEDRILPTDRAWFKFDSSSGTEKILVVFGRAQQDLDTFEIRPRMDAYSTQAVMKTANEIRGGKDLILETETENASEIGTYAVSLTGKPVVLEIQLRHQ